MKPAKKPVNLRDKQILAQWAADCAERALECFESQHPTDLRPRQAIEAIRTWLRGEVKKSNWRQAALAAHAAARASEDPAAIAAARAAGHAAGTAHSGYHASAAAAYAAKAIAASRALQEQQWQHQQLPARLRPIGFPPVNLKIIP